MPCGSKVRDGAGEPSPPPPCSLARRCGRLGSPCDVAERNELLEM